MDPLGQASVSALMQYVRFARSEGLDVSRALAEAGLPEDPAQAGLEHVGGSVFQTFLRVLIESSGDPLLGLRSGQYVQPGSYSTLGYLVMTCSTLGEAVALITPFEKLVGDMGVTRILDEGDTLELRWHCNYTDPLVRPHMMANVLASWTEYARWLAAQQASPVHVRFPFAIDDRLLPEYEQVFGCPVTAQDDVCGIRIARHLLDAPLRQPDARLKATLMQAASEQIQALSSSSVSFPEQVRAVIRQQLDQGVIRRDMVAEAFGLSPRTLVRRLQDAGTSYQALLDEVRAEVARQLVEQTSLPLADISHRLGFAEPRSFFRSFKRWTGTTPGALRQEA